MLLGDSMSAEPLGSIFAGKILHTQLWMNSKHDRFKKNL